MHQPHGLVDAWMHGKGPAKTLVGELEPHALQLAVERFALDAQDFGGAAFVAVGGGEDAADLIGLGVG